MLLVTSPCGKRSGKCPEDQTSILPAAVHHADDERSVDKLRCGNAYSGILFTVIDDEVALISNSCPGKTDPRLIVDERQP